MIRETHFGLACDCGSFMLEEKEEAYCPRCKKKSKKIRCECCKKEIWQPGQGIIHHTSYFPENKIIVCFGCHRDIHSKKGLNGIGVPPENHSKVFYSKKGWIRDSKGFIDRPLTQEEKDLRKK